MKLIKCLNCTNQAKKERRHKLQISKILRMFFKRVRQYYEQLCSNKFKFFNEMNKFLEKHNLPKPVKKK